MKCFNLCWNFWGTSRIIWASMAMKICRARRKFEENSPMKQARLGVGFSEKTFIIVFVINYS